MTMSNPTPEVTRAARPRRFIQRHSATVRITHWLNVVSFSFLLLSGLQILNAHPHLYWGRYGADADHAFIVIGSKQSGDALQGFLKIGPLNIQTTGFLGVSRESGSDTARAFPTWLTIPSYRDLGAGRHWHFFFAWLLLFNGSVYLVHGVWRGHLRRDLLPKVREMMPRHLWREILDHARLRFPRGEAARSYNALQKLSYLGVVFCLLPLMILTGLTMSPGLDAAFHFLPDVFGGRASARTLHFISASLLVLFVAVHVIMVIVSGMWNNLRSMLNGKYAITDEGVRP